MCTTRHSTVRDSQLQFWLLMERSRHICQLYKPDPRALKVVAPHSPPAFGEHHAAIARHSVRRIRTYLQPECSKDGGDLPE